MFKSACRDRRSENRRAISARINTCAQQLTDERGLDGFTMEDLATAAGVSRRTLFNYFPGKLDAVLGQWPDLDEADIATFRAGGPEHDLLADLRTLLRPLLQSDLTQREDLALGYRVVRSEPRLVAAMHQRHERVSEQIVEHIAVREGPDFEAHRARVAVNLLASIFDSALQGALQDPLQRPVLFHFDHATHTARSLLGS
ncbi:MAG: TetR family transcriptional regulator [Ornithinimicrobium sp.]